MSYVKKTCHSPTNVNSINHKIAESIPTNQNYQQFYHFKHNPQNLKSQYVQQTALATEGANTQTQSRFEPWDLIPMIVNEQVARGTDSVLAYIQQINSDSSQQQQYLTPSKNISFEANSHKAALHSTNAKESPNRETIFELKCKPKEKGLRKLSRKSLDIVKEMGSSTYKQVAIRLIKEMQEDQFDPNDEKQESNIKRRVYDALNVLIAMGILYKQGKNIVYSNNMVKQKSGLLSKRELLEQKLKEKEEKMEQKMVAIDQVQQKLRSVKTLVQRNLFSNCQHQKISFPFVAISLSEHYTKSFEEIENSTSIKIMTKEPYEIITDLGLLPTLFN